MSLAQDGPPTFYVPLPAGWATAPKVERLRSEFGTVAMAVFPILLAEAETQKRQGGQRGVVRMTYMRLAYVTAAKAEEVRAVVRRLLDLGELARIADDEFEFAAQWRDWDVWQPPPEEPRLDEAAEFLRHRLQAGERPSAEIESEAARAGIAPTTLKRARKALGIEALKVGSKWVLRMPLEIKGAKGTMRAMQVEVEEEVEGTSTTPRTEVRGSAGRDDVEVARLCHMHADLVLARHPGRKVAPDGQAWRTACSALLDEGYSSVDLAVSIAECDGRIPSMPRIAIAIRSGESLSEGNE